jgi:hypothetical protein
VDVLDGRGPVVEELEAVRPQPVRQVQVLVQEGKALLVEASCAFE